MGACTGLEGAWDSGGLTQSHMPAPGREGLVRARLSNLLACLGELPGPMEMMGTELSQALARFLDDACPAGTVVMHGRKLPGRDIVLENLVIGARGVVVAKPLLAPVPGGGGKQRAGAPRAGALVANRGTTRSAVVRETLHRAYALRAWLAGTSWLGTPVLAAVCYEPAPATASEAPVVLDALWLGAAEHLFAWLMSGDTLNGGTAAALSCFLAAELPVT